MWIYPAAGALIALAFSGTMLRRFLVRRRAYQLLWAAALLMYAVASASLAVGAAAGWSPALYRTYWLLGAILNVPYLATGEIFLLVRRRGADAVFLLLVFATAYAANRVRTGALAPAALVAELPRGSAAWARDPVVLMLARFYSFAGYAVLVAGALWSAWRMRAEPALRPRTLGTLGVVVGATIVAAGSAFAAAGDVFGFSLALTAGISTMYWGFVRASRPSPTAEARSLSGPR